MNLALEEVDFVIGNYFLISFILNSSTFRKVLTANCMCMIFISMIEIRKLIRRVTVKMANVECVVENQILHANIAKNDGMSAKITFHECQILTMFSKFKFLVSFTFDFNTLPRRPL